MANCNKDILLNLLQWNAQSLKPKLEEFQLLLLQEHVHIALISETWLAPEFRLNINQYNVYRRDRDDSYGGIAIITHKSIKAQELSVSVNNIGIEILCLRLINGGILEFITLIYCPSSVRTTQAEWDQVFSMFNKKCIILGDFNAHHTDWSYKDDCRGKQIHESALEFGFVSVNDGQPTRLKLVNGRLQKSSPDITFASADVAINCDWSALSENLGSDHIFIKIKIKYQDQLHVSKTRNYKLADWNTYKNIISEHLLHPQERKDVQGLYDYFIQQINRAADNSIPLKKICYSPSNNFRPKGYWCQSISKLVGERRLALTKFRKNPTPINLNNLEAKILEARRAIQKAKSKDWQTFCNSIDHTLSVSQMWNKMRWVKGYKRSKVYVSLESQSELLCSLTPDYVMPPPPCFTSVNQSLESEFSMGEMRGCFKKKDTAPGEDTITYSMISHLPETGQLYLLNLYNLILKSGDVPTQWRNVKVIAIPKPGSYSNSNNKLRPISLISCICKIFHAMIAKRLEWFVEKNEILSPCTTGFRRGQSCHDCLARLVTDIQIGFTKNFPTLACFLDIKSAYNNVLIEKMLQTLDTLKVGKSICQYLWNFLSERRLKITDESQKYNLVRIARNGLAQGDPISPLLFNIATFKICRDIANINVCQYADDFVLYTTDNSILESAKRMQASLNVFIEILIDLGLEVSTSKSHYCIFSRGRRTHQLNLVINDSLLGKVYTYKYLGIWLDNSLKWSKHINEIVEKVLKFVNLLKILASSSWGLHHNHLRRIYIAIIRSRLDYGSFLFNNCSKALRYKLEKVQNHALRIVGGFIRSTPIHAMESELCVPPLHVRRRWLAFKFCLKSRSLAKNLTNNLLDELCTLGRNRYWSNKEMPLLATTFELVKEEVMDSKTTLDMFSLRTWVTNFNIKELIEFNLDIVNMPKRTYNPTYLHFSVINELREKYSEYYVIFTDGSKNTVGGGAAYYDPLKPNHSNYYKLNKCFNVMSLELIAISEALSYAKTIASNKILICVDSKSALQHIARCASGTRGAPIAYTIISKIDEMTSYGKILKLQWVPSHIGLSGNEKVDSLANKGILEGKELNVKPAFSELLPKYKEMCHQIWKEYFNLRSKSKGIWYKTIVCEPPRIPWFSNCKINRKLLVTALRLRSGHMPLNNFAFLMKKCASPNCEECDTVEDVIHLLTECVRYQTERDILINDLGLIKSNIGLFNVILSAPLSDAAKKLYSFVNLRFVK